MGWRLRCPLCQMVEAFHEPAAVNTTNIECEICGRYVISDSLRPSIEPASPETRSRRSAATRQATERGDIETLTFDNYEALADTHRRIPLATKKRRLLEHIRGLSNNQYGTPVRVQYLQIYPMIDAFNQEEVR